jgi:two-component system response regulator RegA
MDDRSIRHFGGPPIVIWKETPMPRTVTPPLESSRNRARTVLLVDGDREASQVLATWFADSGWSVVVAATCEEAVAAVNSRLPDLLVVEETLGDGCGVDLLPKLRARHGALAGIVLTRQGSIGNAVRAIRMGFQDYLIKPLDHHRLVDLFSPPANDAFVEQPSLDRVEREHIAAVLGVCGGNISEAARRLGIHRRSLQRRLRRESAAAAAAAV